MTTPIFIPSWVGKAGAQLYGEPHTWSLPAFAKWEIRVRSGPRKKPGRVHTGEQIHFPHLARNERDMGHPQLWLGESFNGLPSGKRVCSG
jgi:hypothetical protein